MNPPRPKPAHEIRFGAIKAAIWRNETETGARFNTTFTRIYRDGEQWHHSDNFGREELLLLAKVADHAHSWIHAQQREAAGDSSATNPPPSRPETGTHAPGTPFPRSRPSRVPSGP